MQGVLSLAEVTKSPCPSQAVFSDSVHSHHSKVGLKVDHCCCCCFGQFRGSILVSTKEKQMGHVIDISNKERLLKEIYRVVQLSIP